MKWLTELMESSQSSLEVLPVPCLCEFLMSSYKEQGEGVVGEADTDPSSHRPRYKRRKTAHDKARKLSHCQREEGKVCVLLHLGQ